MYERLDRISSRQVLDAGAHERRRVATRYLARMEAHGRRTDVLDSVEAKAAPVVARQVEGDQVPAPAERDQSVRLDMPRRLVTTTRGVREAQPLLVPTRLSDHSQHAGIDRRPAGVPERGHGRGA